MTVLKYDNVSGLYSRSEEQDGSLIFRGDEKICDLLQTLHSEKVFQKRKTDAGIEELKKLVDKYFDKLKNKICTESSYDSVRYFVNQIVKMKAQYDKIAYWAEYQKSKPLSDIKVL